MEPLPVIPTPTANRVRLLLQQGLPVVFLLVVASIAAYLWRLTVRPTSFVGQVEVIQVAVNSRDAGLLTNLWVTPLQEVKAGDLIAEVITTDPRTVNNRLEVMRDQMRLTQLEMTPVLLRQRSALDYEALSIDCARMRTELATARVNLIQTSNEFRRINDLFQRKDRLVSDSDFDVAKANFEALQVEVQEKTRVVATTEKTLERLAFLAEAYVPGGENDPIKQALRMEEDAIRVFEQKMKPLHLVAPIDGIVTVINRRAGEQVLAGEPLVMVTSRRSDRIVAYVPRTSPVNPQVGMRVEVSTRKLKRETCEAQIIGVGPHWEGVNNPMILPPMAAQPVFIPAIGRPISVSLPVGLDLLPGELVDLHVLADDCVKGSAAAPASARR